MVMAASTAVYAARLKTKTANVGIAALSAGMDGRLQQFLLDFWTAPNYGLTGIMGMNLCGTTFSQASL